ncbi:unnamed protein product [Enterobius vermicularis]|uniref:PAX-interacting protein 1 n=1 Tax=Enterobius vermicularis TaxID=51028 RepID=A0A0N4V9D3_ENTVE|nr:unnamed protein product [Enterobius vermicularis]
MALALQKNSRVSSEYDNEDQLDVVDRALDDIDSDDGSSIVGEDVTFHREEDLGDEQDGNVELDEPLCSVSRRNDGRLSTIAEESQVLEAVQKLFEVTSLGDGTFDCSGILLKKVNVIERSSKAGVVFYIDVVRLKFDSIVCVKGDFVRYLKYEGHCEVGEGKDEERFLKNKSRFKTNNYLLSRQEAASDIISKGTMIKDANDLSKTQTSEVFTSSEFVRWDDARLQKDQESFMRKCVLDQDDYRFNRTHEEKENSWEPSVHNSLLPLPVISKSALLEKANTDSSLHLAGSPGLRKKGHCKSGEEEQGFKNGETVSKAVPLPHPAEPKVSTPIAEKESERKPLRNVSFNITDISSILGNSTYRPTCSDRLPALQENIDTSHDILTRSEIARALPDKTMDDSQLVAALLKAQRKRFRKGNVDPSTLRAERSGATYSVSRVSAPHFSKSQEVSKFSDSKSKRNFTGRTSSNINQVVVKKDTAGASCSNSMVESNRPKILAFKPPFIYFGFVDVGENVDRCLEIRNLAEQNEVVINPLDTYKAHVIFRPSKAAYFNNILQVSVLNVEKLSYSVSKNFYLL